MELHNIKPLLHIKSLDLTCTSITEKGLKNIVFLFPNLESLSICNGENLCENLSIEAIEMLGEIKNLKVLKISIEPELYEHKVFEEKMELIRKLGRLETIYFPKNPEVPNYYIIHCEN